MNEMGQAKWAVAQIYTKHGLSIQEEISRSRLATYLPMMRSRHYADGQLSDTARPAMPGYMFIFGATGNFYARDAHSIARVLGWISDGELRQIRADNAAGRHDKIAAQPASEGHLERKGRRRRPRPSKRARMQMRAG